LSRDGETVVKRLIAQIGYKLINSLSDVQIPRNTGDFRLMSRRIVNELCNLNESHGFLRGLVAYVGFNQTSVYYKRDVRFAGKGNYNRYFGSLRIGLNGLIGFSAKPLNLMSIFGALISSFSFLLGTWYAGQKFLGINLTPGLSTTVILLCFFAGIQLLSLGLMGEYVSRIYDEVKRRPMYIVDKSVGFESENVN
jgi:dolichol-phosphate mannosyltransferase